MQKVKSFTVDHTKLLQGVYVSEVNGCFTYDLRFVKPTMAKDCVPSGRVLHTLEHFFADWFRTKTSYADKVLYIGPMGCKTGFYLLLSERIAEEDVANDILKCSNLILNAQYVPGASSVTCGNYTYFDLVATRAFVSAFVVPAMSMFPLNKEYPLL